MGFLPCRLAVADAVLMPWSPPEALYCGHDPAQKSYSGY
jgi:hypothetical protein